MRAKNRRIRVPTSMVVVGSLIAVASLVGRGWLPGASTEVVTLVAAYGYYVVAGRDTDTGALVGSRADERQAALGQQSAALAGVATSTTALTGFVITTAVGGPAWPFLVLAVVGGAAFLAGQVIYRTR